MTEKEKELQAKLDRLTRFYWWVCGLLVASIAINVGYGILWWVWVRSVW